MISSVLSSDQLKISKNNYFEQKFKFPIFFKIIQYIANGLGVFPIITSKQTYLKIIVLYFISFFVLISKFNYEIILIVTEIVSGNLFEVVFKRTVILTTTFIFMFSIFESFRTKKQYVTLMNNLRRRNMSDTITESNTSLKILILIIHLFFVPIVLIDISKGVYLWALMGINLQKYAITIFLLVSSYIVGLLKGNVIFANMLLRQLKDKPMDKLEKEINICLDNLAKIKFYISLYNDVFGWRIFFIINLLLAIILLGLHSILTYDVQLYRIKVYIEEIFGLVSSGKFEFVYSFIFKHILGTIYTYILEM